MKAGVVAIVGRANVGKSTLMNNLVGEKVAIVSKVPQTTRNQIRAILNERRGQIVFIDTPGMHISKHALDRAMINAVTSSLEGVDVVVHLVDITEYVGEEEFMIMDRLCKVRAPIILGLNKIDCNAKYINEYIQAWQKRLNLDLSSATERLMPVPVSALKGTNLDRLVDEIFVRLPEGLPLYPEDVLTDFPRQLNIQDVVREKFLFYLREELPFSLGIYAEEITDKTERLTYVKVVILVERNTQKSIVIGKDGEMLKKVGAEARKDLEEIYSKKFYLDLFVKVEEDWKEDQELLRKMGHID